MGISSSRGNGRSPLSSRRPHVVKPNAPPAGRGPSTCPHCGHPLTGEVVDTSLDWKISFKLAVLRIVRRLTNDMAKRIVQDDSRRDRAERFMRLQAAVNTYREVAREWRSRRDRDVREPEHYMAAWSELMAAAKRERHDESTKTGLKVQAAGRYLAYQRLLSAVRKHVDNSTYIQQSRPNRRVAGGCGSRSN